MIPKEMLSLIKSFKGGNAQQIAMNLINSNKNIDPVISQMISFAQKGDNNSLLNLATNYFQQQGMDINAEFNSFIDLLR